VRLLAALLVLAGVALGLAARADDNEVDPELVKEGYRPSVVDGHLLYCRREEITGTPFRKNVCLPASEVDKRKRQTRESVEHLEERPARRALPSR
jgi:hypothetical protein